MAKTKTAYFCQSCGHNSPKWLGKCPYFTKREKNIFFLTKGFIHSFMSYISFSQELEEINFMWQKGIFFKMKTGEVLVELHEDKSSKTISIKAKTNALIEKIIEGLRYF